MQKYLGIDLGTKTLGLATSDAFGIIATPLTTIARKDFKTDIAALQRVITQYEITDFVVGLPLNMDGSEGPRAQSTRAFGKNIQNRFNIPVHYWDERLSTMAVERIMLEADMSRAKRSKNIDKLAASYILQGFLDSLQHHNAGSSS